MIELLIINFFFLIKLSVRNVRKEILSVMQIIQKRVNFGSLQ